MKHKHAELIKAWADGAEIEYKSPYGWSPIEGRNPSWLDHSEYRIKPKQSVVRWQWAYKTRAGWQSTSSFYTDDEVVNTSMERVKLEYTRTEFPE